MKIRGFAFVMIALFLSACTDLSRNTLPADRIPTAVSHAITYRIVHDFGKGKDGVSPVTPLALIMDSIYGTTNNGGTTNGGTAFKVSPSGSERVLHSFGGHEGINPYSNLILGPDGKLYGTTYQSIPTSSEDNNGTVYSMTPAGTVQVVHSFQSSTDGAEAQGGLLDVGGTLFGTTFVGGANGLGTVYSVTLSGKERVLHSFGAGSDGARAVGSSIEVNGVFYGETENGGKYAGGTIFSITPSGKEQVLHDFGNGKDGYVPDGGLIYSGGMFYGTTQGGGTYGKGAVFAISPGGNEHVLYSFGKTRFDGFRPMGGVILVGGVFYGTTTFGGSHETYSDGGTVFSLTQSGRERILHNFAKAGDGDRPEAGLIALKGTLFGTTQTGGKYAKGTVFALRP